MKSILIVPTHVIASAPAFERRNEAEKALANCAVGEYAVLRILETDIEVSAPAMPDTNIVVRGTRVAERTRKPKADKSQPEG